MGDRAEKYRDQVDPQHKQAMDAVGFAFMVLGPHADQLKRFLEAEERSHSVMHITDPTAYGDMLASKSFALQVRMAKAATAFIRELEAVKAEATPSQEADDD